MRTLTLVALATLTSIAAPRIADACPCGTRSINVVPDGGALPPRPTIYVYAPFLYTQLDEFEHMIRVEGPGGPVPFTIEDVSTFSGAPVNGVIEAPADPVLAIHIDAAAGPVEVYVPGHRGSHPVKAATPYHYELGAPVSRARPVLESIEWAHGGAGYYAWEGLFMWFHAPGAVAFRARWRDGVEAQLSPGSFYDRVNGEGKFFLGDDHCWGSTVERGHIGRRDFVLIAIYPDGSRRLIAMPGATIGAAMGVASGGAGRRGWWLLAPASLALALAALLVRRRRRRQVAVAV